MSSTAVVHPSHYNQSSVEVITVIRHLNFCLGNVIKYILRAPYKGKLVEDCDKALFYLNWVREDSKENVYTREMKKDIETMINEMDNPSIQRFLQSVDDYLLTGKIEALDSIESNILELKKSST